MKTRGKKIDFKEIVKDTTCTDVPSEVHLPGVFYVKRVIAQKGNKVNTFASYELTFTAKRTITSTNFDYLALYHLQLLLFLQYYKPVHLRSDDES